MVNKFSEKATMVNDELRRLCHENKLMYIDNGYIRTRYHISNYKLHLNDNGSRELAANFANAIRLWLNCCARIQAMPMDNPK